MTCLSILLFVAGVVVAIGCLNTVKRADRLNRILDGIS